MTPVSRPSRIVSGVASLMQLAFVGVAWAQSAPALRLPPYTGAFRPVYPQTIEWPAASPGVDVSSGMITVSVSSAVGLNQAISRIQGAVAQQWWTEVFWEAAKVHPDFMTRADSVFHARWVSGPPAPEQPPE